MHQIKVNDIINEMAEHEHNLVSMDPNICKDCPMFQIAEIGALQQGVIAGGKADKISVACVVYPVTPKKDSRYWAYLTAIGSNKKAVYDSVAKEDLTIRPKGIANFFGTPPEFCPQLPKNLPEDH